MRNETSIEGEVIYDAVHHESPLGKLLLISLYGKLVGLYFQEHRGNPTLNRSLQWNLNSLREVRHQLDQYFAGKRYSFDVTLHLEGTEFQKRVWRQLQFIGFGETRTYGEIAALLGTRLAVRAVGGAIGRNPVSVIIPCHRVVGSGGGLTGYAGRIERKEWLLEHESAGGQRLLPIADLATQRNLRTELARSRSGANAKEGSEKATGR